MRKSKTSKAVKSPRKAKQEAPKQETVNQPSKTSTVRVAYDS